MQERRRQYGSAKEMRKDEVQRRSGVEVWHDLAELLSDEILIVNNPCHGVVFQVPCLQKLHSSSLT